MCGCIWIASRNISPWAASGATASGSSIRAQRTWCMGTTGLRCMLRLQEADHRRHTAIADRAPQFLAVAIEQQHRRVGGHGVLLDQRALLVAVELHRRDACGCLRDR